MDSLLEQRIQYLERLLSTKTRSPIVVQLASLYLEAGRPHDALRYCDNAIAHFPYYTTAHLIRGRVLQALEMKAEARRELEFVHSILPDVVGVRTMLEQIPASEVQTFEEAEKPAEDAVPPPSKPALDVATGAAIETLEETPPKSPPPEMSLGDVEPTAVQTPEEQPTNEGPGPLDEPRDVKQEEDPFGLGVEELGATAAEAIASVDTQDPFPPAEVSAAETDVSTDAKVPPLDAPVSPERPEAYERFAERMKEELSAGGEALTLEEFFARPKDQAKEQPTVDPIEELAEKLKSAPRITPIIDIAEKKVIPPSEEDTPASTEFVTPTLAEIYAKQGWYDDAITAYKTLARIKPAERERFEKRVQELEQLKKAEGGGS